MTDAKTLSYINLYAILGAMTQLCELDPKAKEILGNKRITMEITVKKGPTARLAFENGSCKILRGAGKCNIRLPFSSPEKFNGMIDGTVTPIPSKGLTKIGFLLKRFVPLTDLLTKYLRPSDEDLKDEEFFRVSTLLTFYVVSEALSQIANNDSVGMSSASYIVDGKIKMSKCDIVGAKKLMAFEVTKLVHGEEEAQKAKEAANALFGAGGTAVENMPTVAVKGEENVEILQFLTQIGITASKSEARRLIEQGGISIDNEKIADVTKNICLKKATEMIVKKGKKTFLKVVVE